ncbi:unnamed protein product [Phytophthora lilii]|uniref:dolichol kinase n=1 Tax=Phytophthora lilii TaxID=2077276 RepID=A0A9W6THK9_9STRA|nr:unnamed protein product [Phytophthora lilii]
MGYWIICLVVLIPLFAFIANRFELRNIVARKLFHLLVVLMLGPASIADAPMLSLSYGVALSVFFIVECVRALALPPFGRSVAKFMRSFIDSREAGRVILTHSYLLLGCALPLWFALPLNQLVMNAGVLALGVGDAMGAVVGSSIGKHKIFGSKTVEGSAAVFISIMMASIPLHDYYTRAFTNGEYAQVRKEIIPNCALMEPNSNATCMCHPLRAPRHPLNQHTKNAARKVPSMSEPGATATPVLRIRWEQYFVAGTTNSERRVVQSLLGTAADLDLCVGVIYDAPHALKILDDDLSQFGHTSHIDILSFSTRRASTPAFMALIGGGKSGSPTQSEYTGFPLAIPSVHVMDARNLQNEVGDGSDDNVGTLISLVEDELDPHLLLDALDGDIEDFPAESSTVTRQSLDSNSTRGTQGPGKVRRKKNKNKARDDRRFLLIQLHDEVERLEFTLLFCLSENCNGLCNSVAIKHWT